MKKQLTNFDMASSIRLLMACFALFVGLTASWSEIVHGYTALQGHAETEDVAKSSNKAITGVVIEHIVNTVNVHIRSLGASRRFNLTQSDDSELGLSAGDPSASDAYAFWFAPTYSKFENNGGTKIGLDHDGDLATFLFGFDVLANQNMVFGASLGYEESDSDFKRGGFADSTGYIGALYGAYNLAAATVYIDGGFLYQDNELAEYGTGFLSKGEFDSDTYFINFGIMKTKELDSETYLFLDASYSYADTDNDDYIDSLGRQVHVKSTLISELYFSAEVSKASSWGEYYSSFGTRFDLDSDDNFDNGNIGMDLGFGVRLNASDAWSGDFNVRKLFLKKDEDELTFSANVRYEF